MKILKTGNSKDTEIWEFSCTCGCVFEATRGETHEMQQRPTETYARFCDCPECGKLRGSEVSRLEPQGAKPTAFSQVLDELKAERAKRKEIEDAGWEMWKWLRFVESDYHDTIEHMDYWQTVCSHRTEDGHLKVYCHQCGAPEHIQIMDEHGVCETCHLEEKK